MYYYRLTKRGKILITLLMIFVSTFSAFKINNVAAENKAAYKIIIEENDSRAAEDQPIASTTLNVKSFDERLLMQDFIKLPAEYEMKEEFLSINVEDISTLHEEKIAYLTFDDGPSTKITPQILDILDRYKIKATFFVLGTMVEKNSNVLKDAVSRGNSIGVHSFSHVTSHLYQNEKNFLEEIRQSEEILKKHIGNNFKTRLFRYPGGSFEAYKKQYMYALNNLGYVSIDWNCVNGDAAILNPTKQILIEEVKRTSLNKNQLVVLMHDSDTKQVTADALPSIIEYLISQGYEFALLK